jgi:aminopeptidase N
MIPHAKRLAVGLVLALLVGAPAAAQDAGWQYQRLDLDITIDPVRGTLEVRGEGMLEPTGGELSELLMLVNTRQPAMRFERFETPGTSSAIEFVADSPRVVVQVGLERPITRGETFPISFTMRMEHHSAQLLVSDSVALASWVEAWYPIPLTPERRMRNWTAAGVTRFHLPPGWQAVSNGAAREVGDGDRERVIEWKTEQPVNRSFAAAPYRVARSRAGGREIGVYLLRADSATAQRQVEVLSRAISAMEEVWGPYPYAGYAIAEIPDGRATWAASSEQGFIMATSQNFTADGNLPLFSHEAAHAWWGNLVGTTGPGALLVGESLAQYGAVVAVERLEGHDAMNEFLRFSRRGYNQFQSAHGYFEIIHRGGDKPLAQLSNDTWDHNLSDSKGHWFYHMLRLRIGDELFFGVLRDLIREYAGRALSLADLRAAFLAAAPDDAGLATFLGQWLERTGAPALDHRWWSLDRGAAVHIEITQRQAELYELPLMVEVELVNGHRIRHQVQLTERVHQLRLPLHARPIDVRIDPDHHLLHWRPEYGPRPEM